MAITKSQIVALAQAEQEQFEIWQLMEGPPDAPYWDAIEALLDSLMSAVNGEIFHAVNPAKTLAAEYNAFNATGMATPGIAFWSARESLHAAIHAEPPRLAPLASVDELVNKQKVSLIQVCSIWRFFTATGDPKLELVEQELKSPGSVCTPSHIAWVDRLRLAEAGWGERASAVLRDKPKEAEQQYANIETLILQKVPARQIVSIKSQQYGESFSAFVTPDAILSLANGMGIDLPGSDVDQAARASEKAAAKKFGDEVVANATKAPPLAQASLSGIEIPESKPKEAEAESMSLEEEVIEMFEAGNDDAAIAKHFKIGKKKIREIIDAWQLEPEEVEAVE